MNLRTKSVVASLILMLPLNAACAQTAHEDKQHWTSPDGHYSLAYPQGWPVNENYVFTGLGPSQPLHGTLFSIPDRLANGTNLSADGTGVALLALPNRTQCEASDFLANVRVDHTLVENGKRWSMGSASEGGAGNIYRTQVFARKQDGTCIAVLYLIHSTQIGNYPAGSVTAFDEHELLARFDAIRHSLTAKKDATPSGTDVPASAPPPQAPPATGEPQ